MKKTLLIICFLAISITAVYSQKIGWGLKATYQKSNYSKFGLKEREGSGDIPSERNSFSLSVFLEKNLNNNLSFQPNLTFTNRDMFLPVYARFYTDESMSTIQYYEGMTIDLSYIQMPLLFRYHPFPYLNIYAGPSIGLAVKTQAKLRNSYYDAQTGYFLGSNYTKSTKKEEKELFNSFDAGIQFGLGIEYKKFELGVFYEESFISPFKDRDGIFSYKPRFRAPYVSLGYRFK
ncbi:porin family protein [Solitalea canadensis]|uniref:Outer membrane protein beta-barrel domain-containing protein n=1 Tax=Solitalea canadensis (strain ATCC 29591 / DSM 3403 / JCM 21819 / LMG 8368 / NBRC 15130 / NCIMB 12057 / USAM 9D) TaxID=929556 RepID=H8KMQ2_SOLCM|nr:porin family protein [Solitalea canadensis]AFD09043.1 hypothetical protein Solca_4053 [Solitalea canadensis DSM 3403]